MNYFFFVWNYYQAWVLLVTFFTLFRDLLCPTVCFGTHLMPLCITYYYGLLLDMFNMTYSCRLVFSGLRTPFHSKTSKGIANNEKKSRHRCDLAGQEKVPFLSSSPRASRLSLSFFICVNFPFPSQCAVVSPLSDAGSAAQGGIWRDLPESQNLPCVMEG